MDLSIEKLRQRVAKAMKSNLEIFKTRRLIDKQTLLDDKFAKEVLELDVGDTSSEYDAFGMCDDQIYALTSKLLIDQAKVPNFVFISGEEKESMKYRVTRVSDNEFLIEGLIKVVRNGDETFISLEAKNDDDLLYYDSQFIHAFKSRNPRYFELLKRASELRSFEEIVEVSSIVFDRANIEQIILENPDIDSVSLLDLMINEIRSNDEMIKEFTDRLFDLKYFESGELDYEESFSFTVKV